MPPSSESRRPGTPGAPRQAPTAAAPATARRALPRSSSELLHALDHLLHGSPRPLKDVLEAIFRRPDRTLVVEWERVALQDMDSPDPERSQRLLDHPESLCRAGLGPAHLSTPAGSFSLTSGWRRHTRVSYATRANRELARLVELLGRVLRTLSTDGLTPEDTVRHVQVRRSVDRARRSLRVLRVDPQGPVAAAGAVLEQDPRYRVVRRVLYDLRAWSRRTGARRAGVSPTTQA